MTPEEIIATKLLGWVDEGVMSNGEHWFFHPQHGRARLSAKNGTVNLGQQSTWPDLSNWNDIRRMEEALAEKGLSAKYYSTLTSHVTFNALESFADNAIKLLSALSRSTPEQRVQAALKVIESAGL